MLFAIASIMPKPRRVMPLKARLHAPPQPPLHGLARHSPEPSVCRLGVQLKGNPLRSATQRGQTECLACTRMRRPCAASCCSVPPADVPVGRRFALFDALAWLAGLAPGEGLLVGVLLLAAAAACFPLLPLAPPGLWPARPALTLVAGLGCSLIVLQPPLPIQVRAWPGPRASPRMGPWLRAGSLS